MKKRNILAVFGGILSQKCRDKLTELGFELLPLQPLSTLSPPMNAHADLSLFILDKKVFGVKELFESDPILTDKLLERGYEICVTDESVLSPYPKDIPLNCLNVGKLLFSKKAYTAKKLTDEAKKQGYELINVNQGYARCTACPVSDKGIITADCSIAKAAAAAGIDVLRISPAHVRLEGYEYGFIGGASGVFENTVFFAGDILSHPDGLQIVDFCKKHQKNVISLSDEPLTDVGSIFFLK